MFASNLGAADRIIRIVVGLALILVALMMPDIAWARLGWIGVVPLATGLVGWCGLYRLFGLSTRSGDA